MRMGIGLAKLFASIASIWRREPGSRTRHTLAVDEVSTSRNRKHKYREGGRTKCGGPNWLKIALNSRR